MSPEIVLLNYLKGWKREGGRGEVGERKRVERVRGPKENFAGGPRISSYATG